MRLALAEARQAAARDEVPVGAVVVCRGKVIARAHNLTETLTDVTAHAEMQAITSAAAHLGGKYLTDCTLYVTVEPCLMCAGALGWSQISIRRQTGLPHLLPLPLPSQDGSHLRHPRRRMRPAHDRLLPPKTQKIRKSIVLVGKPTTNSQHKTTYARQNKSSTVGK